MNVCNYISDLRAIDQEASKESKYYPFIDKDNNGVIIITALRYVSTDPNEMTFTNISGIFSGEGLSEPANARMVTYDFKSMFDWSDKARVENLVADINSLYNNALEALCLRNLMGMSYERLSGGAVSDGVGAIQWHRSDFDKLIRHIRKLAKGCE